jgi:hypothetical protein
LFKGPYQNETGSDGIGDSPYVIDANNVDHYPLMTAKVPFLVFIDPPSASIVIGESVEFKSVVFGGRPPYSYQWFLNGSAIPNATLSAWVFTPETKGFYIVHLEVKDSLNTSKSDDSFVTVKWVGTVYIRADGSIEPPDAPVTTYDNITYKLTDDIVSYGDGIIVQRNNVIVNGAGHTVQGLESWETKGIDLSGRVNVTVSNLTVTGFCYGVWLSNSSSERAHNKIYENYIVDNYIGLWLFSSDNEIYENNIANNGYYYAWYGYGISISGSGNRIYHNNFINNAHQAKSYDGNVWDNGYPFGGNYWSDYAGVDFYSGPYQNETGSDGMGDTPCIIDANNIDRYPLMAPFKVFKAKHWDGLTYNFHVISNSIILNFELFESLIPEIPSKISLNVSGPDNTNGFCRITIPNIIVQDLWQNNYMVLLNGEPYLFKNWTDSENTYIYINYMRARAIVIIPEYPSALILVMLMLTTLIAAIPLKKRRTKNNFLNSEGLI